MAKKEKKEKRKPKDVKNFLKIKADRAKITKGKNDAKSLRKYSDYLATQILRISRKLNDKLSVLDNRFYRGDTVLQYSKLSMQAVKMREFIENSFGESQYIRDGKKVDRVNTDFFPESINKYHRTIESKEYYLNTLMYYNDNSYKLSQSFINKAIKEGAENLQNMMGGKVTQIGYARIRYGMKLWRDSIAVYEQMGFSSETIYDILTSSITSLTTEIIDEYMEALKEFGVENPDIFKNDYLEYLASKHSKKHNSVEANFLNYLKRKEK